ncbi:MAG: hypothetical protein Q4C53_04925 [Clostridia bacterium]|nr:hypothetical protein [Clostridia bacterium]
MKFLPLIRKTILRAAVLAGLSTALALPAAAASAELVSGQNTVVTADGSNQIGSMIVREISAKQAETGDSGILRKVELSEDRKLAFVKYETDEEAAVTVRFFNDYEKPEDKRLIAETEAKTAEPGKGTLMFSLAEIESRIPEYFELEAVAASASGAESRVGSSVYSESISFAANATEEDFPAGYYVPVNIKGGAPKAAMFALNDAEEGPESTGSVTGYIAYNTDLVLLDSDTQYTVNEKKNTVTFSPIPTELAALGERGMAQVGGVVVRGEDSIEDDVFFLNAGATVNGDSMTMQLAEPESLGDLYDTMNLTMTAADGDGGQNGYFVEEDVFDEIVEGKVK